VDAAPDRQSSRTTSQDIWVREDEHKGFLTDLEFVGAFSDDMMAWGPEALNISSKGSPTFEMTAYTPYDRSTSMPPDRTKRFRRISSPRRFEIAATTVPTHLPDLAEQITLGVRIQILFPVRGRGGEVTVGYECDIQEPQPWYLTVEECTYIAMLEAGPTDPEIAKQLGVPNKQRSLTGLYIATLLVQISKAGTWVDISRDTAGRRVLVDKDIKIEVFLAPLPNLQLAGPD